MTLFKNVQNVRILTKIKKNGRSLVCKGKQNLKKAQENSLCQIGRRLSGRTNNKYAIKTVGYSAIRAFNGGQWDEAERMYTDLYALGRLDAGIKLGQIFELKGNLDEALKCYKMVVSDHPKSAEARYQLGRLLARLDIHLEAIAHLEQAISMNREDPKYSEKLLEMLPKNTPLWRRLAVCELGKEAHLEKVGWFREIFRLQWSMNRFSAAMETLDEIEKLDSLNSEELYFRGLQAAKAGDSESAIDAFGKSVRGQGAKAEKAGASWFAEKRGEWRTADELLTRYPGRAERSEILFQRGICAEKLYDWSKAATFFSAAVSLNPNEPKWYYKVGLNLERQSNFASAADAYRTALGLSGQKGDHWWYRLGMCELGLGRHEPAVRAFANYAHVDLPTHEGEETERSSCEREPLSRLAGEPFGGLASVGPSETDLNEAAPVDALGETCLCETPPTFQHHLLSGASGLEVEEGLLFETPGELLDSYLLQFQRGIKDLEQLRSVLPLLISGDVERIARYALAFATAQDWETAAKLMTRFEVFRYKDGLNPKSYVKTPDAWRNRHYAESWKFDPIAPKLILWESNHGASIGCHPLALFHWFTNAHPNEGFIHVWAVKNIAIVPDDLLKRKDTVFVELHSREYLQYLATAKFLVNNVSFAPYFIRRPEQLYLNTWHGTPLKTLGKSMRGEVILEYSNLQRNFQQTTHLMAPNQLTKWALLEDHDLDEIYRGKSIVAGSPRLDGSINQSKEEKEAIFRRLGISPDDGRRIVFYAPTWRGATFDRYLDQDALIADLSALSEIDDIIVLFRAHRLTEKLLSGLRLPVAVVPKNIDTNELLGLVDVLVTDYSSIAFDFIPQERPIVYYMYDFEEYSEKRGLYLDTRKIPGLKCFSRDELKDSVCRALAGEGYPNEEHLAKYAPMEDGRACTRVGGVFFDGCELDDVLEDHSDGHRVGEKKSIVFHASMIPNGICSAFISLLTILDYEKYSVSVIVEPKVLRAVPERYEQFLKLPAQVKVICRDGGFVDTIKECAANNAYNNVPEIESPAFWKLYWERGCREVRRILGDFIPDSAVEYDGYAELWVSLIASMGKLGSAVSCYQHNQMDEEFKLKYPNLRRTFGLYSHFDNVISVSPRLAEHNCRALNRIGYDVGPQQTSARNVILPDVIKQMAVEDVPYKNILEKFSATVDTLVVNVGRMSQEKNQLALIEAIEYCNDMGYKVGLVIAGSGLLEGALRHKIISSRYKDRFLLLGQVANPYPLIRAGAIFALPSLHEGQPVTLLEAMTLGSRILSTNIPGSNELIELGYGYRCRPDSEGISKALIEMLEDYALGSGEFDSDAFSREAYLKTVSTIAG